jgi:HK97 family phage major capsid protein
MDFETASFPPAGQAENYPTHQQELMQAFESFKQANDARLDEIEKRQQADIVTEEKVNRLNDEIGRLQGLMQRPALEAAPDEAHVPEQRAAFRDFLRGSSDVGGALQSKTFRLSADDDGGFLLPHFILSSLEKHIAAAPTLRRFARSQSLEAGDSLNYVRPTGHMAAKWVTEVQARAVTQTPQFEETVIRINELYANPAASQRFLEDVGVDIESWLVESISDGFTRTEGKAFIEGDGSDEPGGILNETTTAQKSEIGAKVYAPKSGVNDKLPAADDILPFMIDFAYGLASGYREKAIWLMNNATQAEMRKIKDSDGHYVWSPANAQGMTASLLGYPVHEDMHMPDIAAGKMPIAFGSFYDAYLIVSRQDTQILRDPFSVKPYVMFYATRRVGGAVVDKSAYRLVKIGS